MAETPETPVRDRHGREHDILVPALELGIRYLPAPGEPSGGSTVPVHPCDRILEAKSSGEALTAAAAAIDGIAARLADEHDGPAAFLPDDTAAAQSLEEEIRHLRNMASRLRIIGPYADRAEAG
jgi:hypothetical protein